MQPNTLLDAILDEAGISHAGLAAHVNQAGRARGLALRYEHTAVARWLKGQRPRGQVPDLICEVLGGRLRRPVGPALQRPAARGVDVGRRSRPAHPARAAALRRGGCRQRRPRDPLHHRQDRPPLPVAGSTPGRLGERSVVPAAGYGRRDGLAGVLIVLAAVNVIVRRVRYLANVEKSFFI